MDVNTVTSGTTYDHIHTVAKAGVTLFITTGKTKEEIAAAFGVGDVFHPSTAAESD